MERFVIIYLLLINAASFLLMLVDKRKAIKKRWRIPESTLIMSAVLGGSIGALGGMHLFRHKTRHLKFSLGIPAILMVQVGIVLWLALFRSNT